MRSSSTFIRLLFFALAAFPLGSFDLLPGVPSVTVTAPSGPTNSSTLAFTVVFSEAVTGFDTPASDLTITTGTGGTVVGAIVAVNAFTYTVNITGMATTAGTVSLAIPAAAAKSISTTEDNTASSTANVVWDGIAPTVTIDQGGSQTDPTNNSPVVFDVVFSEAVSGFTNGDITLSGTAGATTAVVSGGPTSYTVNVSGMTADGTVIASIPANAAQDAAGNNSGASSSTDNSVTFNAPPSVTVEQAGGQADPANTSPILFTATFSEDVTGFATGDVTFSGAGATTATVSGGPKIYTITVTGMSSVGTVTASIGAGVCIDAGGASNLASTSTDNSVYFDDAPPTASSPFSPADNATGIATNTSFVITFSENIQISATSASGTEDNFQIKRTSDNAVIIDVVRSSGDISISGNQATIINSGADLALNTDYYVFVGSKVFSDLSGNDFAGISSTTTWNFKTSAGATVNNLTSSSCTGKFSVISNIVITETGVNNIQGVDNASRTIILGFDGPGFIFNPSTSGVTVSAGNDYSAVVTSVSYTDVVLTLTFDSNADNESDVITLQGLKVAYDGSSSVPVHIRKTGGTLTIQGVTDNSTNLATLTSATQSATPGISTTDRTYCVGENIAATTVTASGAGPTFTWYNDALLTSQLGTGSSINVTTLGISSAAAGTFTKYVTMTEASKCESPAFAVVFTVVPLPVADAGADKSACFGTSTLIGGSPTLSVPSGPGPYTYAWTDNSGGTTYSPGASSPNPTITPPDPGASDQNWNYTVTITDVANGCQGTDVMVLTVKNLSEVLSFTPADNSFFYTSTPAQDLNPNIAGGTFSGVGVVTINNPSPPPTLKTQFNPSLSGTGNFPVTYVAPLANGCQKSVTNTFTVSSAFTFYNNGFDSNNPIYSQYCNNEGTIDLRITSAALTQIESYVYTWNTYYVPSYGYSPITFNGLIRSYYENGIYGYGSNNSISYPGGTYSVSYTHPTLGAQSKNLPITRFNVNAFATDNAYPGCPSCTYAYLDAFVEFVSPAATYPYNIGVGLDYGYTFNNGTKAAFDYSGAFIYINPVPNAAFAPMNSGLVSADQFCNSTPAQPYKLTGNKPYGFNGYFEISSNGSTFVKGTPPALGLTDLLNGTANFDPHQAFIDAGNPPGAQPIYIHYSVDPGTTGSGAIPKKCIGNSPNQLIYVNPLPTVDINPALGTSSSVAFCFDDPPVNLQSSPANSSVRITGPGISDLMTGNAKFTPTQAFQDAEFAAGSTLTTTQTMNIVATITDVNGCQSSDNFDYLVNPLPAAVAPTAAATVCYLGADIGLNVQPSSFIDVVCTSTPSPFTYITQGSLASPIGSAGTITFDPSAAFDAAVAQGANPLATLQFEVRYTKVFIGGGVSCINALAPIALNVAPQIPPNISGFTQIGGVYEYCSNEGTKKLTLTPSGGLLYINNVNVSYNTDVNGVSTYDFTPGLAGGTFTFRYDVITGSNCLNQDTKTVTVLPSPVAQFSSPPKCKDDVVPFNADGTLNTNGVPTYTWTFEGQQVTGQNTTYQFSGTGTYAVNLSVAYPAAGINSIVCASSLTQDQFVGLIPVVDFDVSELCEGDQTKFLYKQAVTTISQAQWDFGDGTLIPFGQVTQSVTGSSSTSGTYGNPIHSFPSANATGYTVTLTGRTSAQTGSCAASRTKNVTVLKYISGIGPSSPYNMKALNGENGFWTIEDANGNSTWEFAPPAGTVINSPEKSWVTNAAGAYKSDDNSFINSPCIDISAFTRPVFSLKYWEDTQVTDGAVLQYSINGGQTWQTLGTLINNFSSGQNWYNAVGISSSPGGQSNYGWSTRDMTDWLEAKHSLDPISGGRNKVRFRLAFRSVNSSSPPTREGFAFNDVKIEERNRTILVENFTNESAANAPVNNANFRSFKSGLTSSEIVKIQYATSFPGNDAINTQNTIDPAARSAFYGITQVPKAYIDGYTNGTFNGIWDDQYFSLRSLNPSPVQLSFQPVTPDPNRLVGKLRVTASQALAAGAYTAIVAIVERQVSGEDFVLRKMLPSASGTPLPNLAANATFDVDFSWELDSRVVSNAANIQVLAFVQKLQGDKEVLQSAMWTSVPSVSVVTGDGTMFESGDTFFPNPADKEITITLKSPAFGKTPVRLIDPLGKSVHESDFEKGEHRKMISTKDLSEGIYILQIGETGSDKGRKKVLVVHDK